MAINEIGKHTHNEIVSQPQIWQQVISRIETINNGFPRPEQFDQVLFTGCGSPFFLSRWAAMECEKTTGVFSRAVPSSDLLIEPNAWLSSRPRTLLVAVSRSAHTTETIRAVQNFQKSGGISLVITCYPENELGKITPYVIGLPEGQEESIAQTRSFTSMMLGAASWIEGKIPPGVSKALGAAGNHLLENFSEITSRLGKDRTIERFFFLGSGSFYGLANELMLKMKEISLSYSESFHFLEFRHGPMSMVNDKSLVVGLLKDHGHAYEIDVLKDMRKLGARTLAICEEDSLVHGVADEIVVLKSELAPLWRAPLYLPILQLLAFGRAIEKGLNPDTPNNLEAVVVLNE